MSAGSSDSNTTATADSNLRVKLFKIYGLQDAQMWQLVTGMNAALPFPHVSNSWLVETSFSSLKALNRGGGHLHTIRHKKPHHPSPSNCWRSHLAPDVLLSVCLGKPCSVFLPCHVPVVETSSVWPEQEWGPSTKHGITDCILLLLQGASFTSA